MSKMRLGGKREFTEKETGGLYEPWYVREAIDLLDKLLTKDMIGFEWGGGGSTIWIAQRIKRLVTVENVKKWIDDIATSAKKFNLDNITLQKFDKWDNRYSGFINKFPDNYFDCIFIDSHQRTKCIKNSINKLKSKGILVLDNSNWTFLKKAKKLLDDWDEYKFSIPYDHEYLGKKYKEWATTIWIKP